MRLCRLISMCGVEVNPLLLEKKIGKFSEVQEQREINMIVSLKKVMFMYMVYTSLYDYVHTYICMYVICIYWFSNELFILFVFFVR